MRLSAKAQRGVGLLAIVAMLGFAAWLILTALEDNIVYFYGPSELIEKPLDRQRIRVGGLVVDDSVKVTGSSAHFRITDGAVEVAISYEGILPDLFRAGQGIIAEGHYDGNLFTADTILAKHDENYMPKEVADALKKQGVWQDSEQ
jgi:cytochrome c-type biogenesis protein CcmE